MKNIILVNDKKLKVNDSKSNREVDENGYMRVSNNILTSAEISEYIGKEIAGYEKIGLDPNKTYKIYRPIDELEKALPNFKNLPLLSDHIYISASSPKKDIHIGSIGSDLRIEGDDLIGDLIITDQKFIDKINEGLTGLSCSYTYVPVIEEGEYNGDKYDIKMTEITGNHVALVDNPRVGKAGVSDSKEVNNIKKGNKEMSIFKKLFSINKVLSKDSDVSKDDIVETILEIATGEDEHADKLKMIGELLKKASELKSEDEDENQVQDEDENQVSDEDENKVEDEDNKVQDEDLVVSADEEDDKLSASDSKTLLKKIKAFDSAVVLCEKVVGSGKVDRNSFNYNTDKLVNSVLKSKNIAFDSKTLNQKLALVEALSIVKSNNTNTNSTKNKTQANDSANNASSSKSVFELFNK